MMLPRLGLIKTLIKSSLDNYLSPGALAGTEILLFYLAHWKRKLCFVTWEALFLIITEPGLFRLPEIPTVSEARVERPEPDHVPGETRNSG